MMIGQGSPSALRWRFAFLSGLVRMGQLALAALVVCTATALVAAEPTMRVRIAWGGGTERTWQGTVRLSAGTLSDPSALGVEADEPGSMWLSGGNLEIRARSSRAYDGVDLTLSAPSDAKLIVEMSPRQAHSRVEKIEVPLAELLRDLHNSPLDDQGNRLLVRRAPGDVLRVRFAGDSLVFAPGDTLPVEIEPELSSLPPGTAVHVKTQLFVARGGRQVWIDERDAKLADKGATPTVLPVQVSLPREEGVYDLVIEASERGILRISKTLAERRVQLVVVAPQAPTDPAATTAVGWKVVQELDPTSSSWWDRMAQLPGMSSWRTGPLSSGHSSKLQHPLGMATQVAPAGRNADVAWDAYPLSVSKPGVPHILEIEYPSDIPQTMGISLMEPNAAGAVMPIGLDSGVDVPDDGTSSPPRWLKHQLIFWPATKNPLVLITNRRANGRIVYGKIRVLAGPTHLPRAVAAGKSSSDDTRWIGGYLNRPLFPENFSATESLDSWSGRSLDDWQTFYEGGTRLVEYLNHLGHNGVLLSVLADGSTIYPSDRLEPTPRYDTGTFFDQGFDPVRKDVAELLFRLFDRERLKLIPTLQFAAPLPELEELLRQGGRDSVGIEWVGADGATWLERNEPTRGLAPYYNPLNARVQQAILNVVRELAPRYAGHSSFAGLAIELSAEGYMQLPGDEWGFDDETMARFEHDTGVRVPGAGDHRFADRAKFLLGPQHHAAWVDWRAAALAEFHRRIQQEVTAARDGAKLYLVPTNPLNSSDAQHDLRPALPSRAKIDDVLRTAGLRTSLYRDLPDLVFVRPQRISPAGPITTQPLDLELNRAAELDRQLGAVLRPAAVFYHEPQKVRIASFDAKSPWGKAKTYTWLVSQITPSGDRNRQRFVHSLATLDPHTMFDGGWMLPLGQESSLVDLIMTYRALPAARFVSLDEETQPVTIRTLSQDGQTWIYFANDSPWEATVRLRVDMPTGCRVEEISGLRRLPPLTGDSWTVELGAYDVLAARFSAAPIRFWKPEVHLNSNVETVLNQRIQDVSSRAASLAAPTPLPILANPSFEQPAKPGQIPGWTINGVADVRPDATPPQANNQSGPQSIQFVSKGAPAALRSDPFDPPKTGRLSVSVWLKVAQVNQQPTMRLAVEGVLDGKQYYRFAPVGAGPNVNPISDQWSQFVLPLEDLPTEGLSQLRVRFDLAGNSEVWVDDVQLFDLAFSNNERIELTKIITLANIALQTGKISDCTRVLDGYWPRFLLENVPLAQQPVALQQPPQQPAAAPPPPVAKPAEKPVEKAADKSGTWVKRIWPF